MLLGFAARIYAFDTTYIDPDRANVHGIGLVVLDKLLAGKLLEVPLFSDPASILLPIWSQEPIRCNQVCLIPTKRKTRCTSIWQNRTNRF